MDNKERNQLLEAVIKVAKQAGLMMKQQNHIEITEKEGHANYVTNMDIACQNYIIKELTPLLDADFMAEESDKTHVWKKDYTWVIDPIDGTTNFARGYMHSCISIALAYKEEVILGVVYNPFLDETFHALKHQGSFLNGKPIRVSNNDVSHALITFGTALYDLGNADITFDTAKAIFVQVADVRRSGSAALDLCYVACGRTDGFFEFSLSPWDHAAGALIVKEAGGLVEGLQKPYTLHHPLGIIAGNMQVFPLLQAETRK